MRGDGTCSVKCRVWRDVQWGLEAGECVQKRKLCPRRGTVTGSVQSEEGAGEVRGLQGELPACAVGRRRDRHAG